MNARTRACRLTVLSAALLAAFGSARAEDDEVAALTKPDSTLSLGLGNWSSARPQEGIYDGMRQSGPYVLLDTDIRTRDDETGTWFNFKTTHFGLENREFRSDYVRQGNYGATLEYSKTVRDSPYTINTGLQGIGSTTLTTGTNVASAPKTNVELGITRELWHIAGFKDLSSGLEAKLDFRTEDKKGTRQWGWGSAALFSVEPIDSTTRQLEATLQYTGKRLQLSGGYLGSWYDNHNTMVLEQLNGVSGGTNASFNSTTPMSLPLSNQAHQLYLDGGYTFTPSTRGTFKLSYTRAMQDEHLPSYDLTGANAPFINAPSHLNGLVNTTLAQFGLSSRPTAKLSLVANLRYYDVNDKTPLAGYVGSNTTGVATVYNTPQSYTTTSGKLEATYRLPADYSVIGGVDYAQQNRSMPVVGSIYVPYRADTTEVTYRAQLRRMLADNLNGNIAYLHSERTGSGYIDANASAPYSNQINPVAIADRNRDKIRTSFDWEATEKLSLELRVDLAQDRYPANGRDYGLKDGSAKIFALDSTYTFSDDWQLNAWYSRDETKAREDGIRVATGGAATALREANLKDIGDSLGISLRGKLSKKIESTLSLDWFKSTSSYPQDLTLTSTGTTYPTGSTGPLPDVHDNLLRLKLDTKYALDKRSDLGFAFIYERWHTDDWSWSFADGSPFAYYSGTQNCAGCTGAGYTGVVDGTTVNAKTTQSSYFFGVRYIYKY